MFAFKLSRDVSNRVFPAERRRPPASTSRRTTRSARTASSTSQKINAYHVSLLPYLLEQLKNTPTATARCSTTAWSSTGRRWATRTCTTTSAARCCVAGHAGGRLKGNLHVKAADGTPMANAMLSVLHALGVEVDSFGDSTGALDLNARRRADGRWRVAQG